MSGQASAEGEEHRREIPGRQRAPWRGEGKGTCLLGMKQTWNKKSVYVKSLLLLVLHVSCSAVYVFVQATLSWWPSQPCLQHFLFFEHVFYLYQHFVEVLFPCFLAHKLILEINIIAIFNLHLKLCNYFTKNEKCTFVW